MCETEASAKNPRILSSIIKDLFCCIRFLLTAAIITCFFWRKKKFDKIQWNGQESRSIKGNTTKQNRTDSVLFSFQDFQFLSLWQPGIFYRAVFVFVFCFFVSQFSQSIDFTYQQQRKTTNVCVTQTNKCFENCDSKIIIIDIDVIIWYWIFQFFLI